MLRRSLLMGITSKPDRLLAMHPDRPSSAMPSGANVLSPMRVDAIVDDSSVSLTNGGNSEVAVTQNTERTAIFKLLVKRQLRNKKIQHSQQFCEQAVAISEPLFRALLIFGEAYHIFGEAYHLRHANGFPPS